MTRPTLAQAPDPTLTVIDDTNKNGVLEGKELIVALLKEDAAARSNRDAPWNSAPLSGVGAVLHRALIAIGSKVNQTMPFLGVTRKEEESRGGDVARFDQKAAKTLERHLTKMIVDDTSEATKTYGVSLDYLKQTFAKVNIEPEDVKEIVAHVGRLPRSITPPPSLPRNTPPASESRDI